mmetsp:Transcript_4421/g.8582  ORF Transcript_4421/g.8582 Transcript_4421/m.8582 type:complete len:299 (-) Transcript_4421:213-1109(-)|eukprot:CAMPEP_0113303642 /NCGR_PEP_ID=MMETSP0010_2-20120614/3975_1 /TAXON_ID=216773 ORGANISM="Corethron hystrix, Strain 308" /NCGR_SAMPLE_ID=MMETSP0010_2 /ASSEMBLY_ACC=CAM_ASM_000155 /LENGTH=298 /DNA_ID=CAMNT_0000157677 /DNA_START=91 /DNA_END=987 /DNA_ORIENTATION=- /assembly_acc=CAM_ASM_000155
MGVFDMGIATIVAREVLEGTIIVGQYRTVLLRSEHWEGKNQERGLKLITRSALAAGLVAVLMVLAIALPIYFVTGDIDERTLEIIEGVSKIVAALFIFQFSLKIPKFLEISPYHLVGKAKDVGITDRDIKFNVAWNIWRETAETIVFLVPYFASGGSAIPVSALVGIAIGLLLGLFIYYGNKNFEDRRYLAAFMAILLGMLSVGLFVGGCHEFEEVFGETSKIYKIQNSFWSHKALPMVIFKPFGYSAGPTILMTICFWLWLGALIAAHVMQNKRVNEKHTKNLESKIENADVEKAQE